MMSPPQYKITCNEAAMAFHQGQLRQAADNYWKAFGQATLVSRWAEYRYGILTGYTSILLTENFRASDQDLRNLQRKVLNDPDEAILYRVTAGHALALLSWHREDREAAADCYRRAIALADSATERELSMTVLNEQHQLQAVREIIPRYRKLCANNLVNLENPITTRLPQIRPDGTIPPSFKRIQTPLNDPELTRRTVVGGKDCDSCHKTLAELGIASLNCCAACKAAYYCSQRCQRAAWKAGHREACRKPDERRTGDMMRLVGLQARPELNGSLVTLIEAEPNDRWQVRLYGDERIISVSTNKLVHLRPAK